MRCKRSVFYCAQWPFALPSSILKSLSQKPQSKTRFWNMVTWTSNSAFNQFWPNKGNILISSLLDTCPGRLPPSLQHSKYCERSLQCTKASISTHAIAPLTLLGILCAFYGIGECAHTHHSDEENDTKEDALIIWDCSWELFGRFGSGVKPLVVFQKRNSSFLYGKLTFPQVERKGQWFQVQGHPKGNECPISPLADMPKAILLLTESRRVHHS